MRAHLFGELNFDEEKKMKHLQSSKRNRVVLLKDRQGRHREVGLLTVMHGLIRAAAWPYSLRTGFNVLASGGRVSPIGM